MKNSILEMEQEFHEAFEAFCAHNCIKHILNYYDVENPFMYLDTSLNIQFIEVDNDEEEYKVITNIDLLLPPFREQLMELVPIEKTNEEVWLDNKKELDDGNILITCVDIYELSYTQYYQKYHSNHCVVLCGYTEDEKNVKVLDWYEWVYRGNVKLEEFLKARGSLCEKDSSPYSGVPINNVWIKLKQTGWNGKIEELLKLTLQTTIERYYNVTSDVNTKEFRGMEAVRRVLELLMDHKGNSIEDKQKFISYVETFAMYTYKRLRIFHFYLKESLKLLQIDELARLVEEVDEDVMQWKKLQNIIIKGSFIMNDKIYSKILQQYNYLISREENRYELLLQLSKLL